MGLTPQERDELERLQGGAAAPAPTSAPQSPAADSVSLSFTPTPTPTPAPTAALTPAERAELADLQSGAPAPQPAAEPAPVPGPDEIQQPMGGFAALYEHAFPSGPNINEEHEKLPDWLRMPEMLHPSLDMVRAHLGAGATMAGADRTKEILEKRFPGIDIQKDGRYLLITSPSDGKKYAFKPGFRPISDGVRIVEGILAGAAAGVGLTAAAGAGGAALAGMGATTLGAALPAAVAAIPTTGVVGGAVTQAGNAALQAGLQKFAGGANVSAGDALGQVAGGLAFGAAIPLAGGAARGAANALFGSAPAAEAAVGAAAMSAPQLAAKAVAAARGGASAAEDVAAQVKPDPNILAAAERQGLTPQIHADQASTNPTFQQVSQAIPGAAERHAATSAEILKNLEQLVTNAGGDVDRSVLETTIKNGIEKQTAEYATQTKAFYDTVKAAVPPTFPTPASKLVAKIDAVLSELGAATSSEATGKTKDVLRGELNKLRNVVTPPSGAAPTWRAMDVLAKELGAATAGKGAFKKLSPGVASELLPSMVADRLAVAEGRGVGDAFTKSVEAFKVQKAFEDAAAEAFGEKSAQALARLSSGAKGLSKGFADQFATIINAAPEALRPKIAASSVLSVFERSKDFSPEAAVRWFDGLQSNENAYNALMKHLDPEMREGLKDSVTLLRGVTGAMSQKGLNGKTLFREDVPFFKILLATGLGHGAGHALNAVGIPIPPGVVSTAVSSFVVAKMLKKTPLLDAMEGFVTSPAGRAAIEGSAMKAPLSGTRTASIAAAASFQRFMDALNVPASGRTMWLERALAQAANTGVQSYNQQPAPAPTPYAQPQPVKEN